MNEQGWSTLLSGRNGVRSITLAGGVALHAVNVYIVVTILPSLVADIHGEQYYSWAATIFVTASLIGASLAAKLLARFGPKTAYVLSALLFAAGTLICSVAPTMAAFLFGRLIQGFGGGFLLSLSYSMVRIVFDPALWPRAMGLISGMWGISTLLGPAIGGIFAEYSTWRASFWTVGILALLFSGVALKVLPASAKLQNASERLPVIQLAVLTIMVLLISASSAVADNNIKIAGIIIGAILLFVLGIIDNHSDNKMLPDGSFSIQSIFLPLYGLMVIISVAVNGAELYLPLFLQELHGRGPLVAGYIAALMSIGWTCGSLPSAGASPKIVRKIIILAPVIDMLGMATLFYFIPSEMKSSGFLISICIALFLIGVGAGTSWPHLLTRVLQCASEKDATRASASLTTIQLFSTALSAALAGSITNLAGLFNPGGVSGMIAASKVLFIFLIVILLLAVPLAFIISRDMFNRPDGKHSDNRSNQKQQQNNEE